jgi:aldose 1-epimerase
VDQAPGRRGGAVSTALRGEYLSAEVVALGARLARLRVPDAAGVPGDVVLGLSDYRADRAYLGATVGRYANRLAGGAFVLDGRRYTVPRNEGTVALHGGTDGFDRQEFTTSAGDHAVTFRRTSQDGENGFPGNLEVAVTYTVRDRELEIEHTAVTDAPTVVNLANHAYLNLAGAGSVEGHRIRIAAAAYLPVDAALIPTGECAPVAGTPFDLRTPTPIGRHLRADHPQLHRTRGYDHCYVLDGGPGLREAAYVEEPVSGRTLTLLTDQPGLQFYSGNSLDGSFALHDGTAVRQGDAFCLEAQAFPDAPNQPSFPSAVLRPGETYRSRTVFRFGVLAP